MFLRLLTPEMNGNQRYVNISDEGTKQDLNVFFIFYYCSLYSFWFGCLGVCIKYEEALTKLYEKMVRAK